jgi:hypothetical protein|tara:strand:+ start:1172 stop:2047 length:876 start_codon:yes stop_codon:yes gene_type:complete
MTTMEYNITNTNFINIKYNTNNHNINLDIKFGEGKDSDYYNEEERKYYKENYNVEIYEKGNEGEEEYQKGYRVVGNEGPLVISLENITISSKEDNMYEYAVGFAVDNKEPLYYNENNTVPNNIERDGIMWTVPANKYKRYKFDQNAKGEYQWMIKRALEKEYKLTEEENELGLEETTEETGLIYLTFMVFRKNKDEEIKKEVVYRGATRGATRGVTRGTDNSDGARFGYGNLASSQSKKSEYNYVYNTEKYILPIRMRINKSSENSDINCSKHLNGAELNNLKKRTMVVPY